MNVGEWVSKWASLYPDEPYVKCGDLILTRRQFNGRINQTSHALLARGARKGDRVAGLLANGNEFLEILRPVLAVVPFQFVSEGCCELSEFVHLHRIRFFMNAIKGWTA